MSRFPGVEATILSTLLEEEEVRPPKERLAQEYFWLAASRLQGLGLCVADQIEGEVRRVECDDCGGSGVGVAFDSDGEERDTFPCRACAGAGYNKATIEAALKEYPPPTINSHDEWSTVTSNHGLPVSSFVMVEEEAPDPNIFPGGLCCQRSVGGRCHEHREEPVPVQDLRARCGLLVQRWRQTAERRGGGEGSVYLQAAIGLEEVLEETVAAATDPDRLDAFAAVLNAHRPLAEVMCEPGAPLAGMGLSMERIVQTAVEEIRASRAKVDR